MTWRQHGADADDSRDHGSAGAGGGDGGERRHDGSKRGHGKEEGITTNLTDPKPTTVGGGRDRCRAFGGAEVWVHRPKTGAMAPEFPRVWS